jgi:hypothetical protein
MVWLLVLVPASVMAGPKDGRPPLTVLASGVTGVKSIDEGAKKQLAKDLLATYESAKRAAKATALSDQTAREYLEARDALLFGTMTQKDVDDSVQDIGKHLLGQKRVQPAPRAEESALLVKVVGRGWVDGFPRLRATVMAGPRYPGAALGLARLAWMKEGWIGSDQYFVIAHLKEMDGGPGWEVEITGMKPWWGKLAKAFAQFLDKAVDDSYEEVTSGASR